MSAAVNVALLAVMFGGLFIVAELLHRRAGVAVEITRKLVHTGTGLLTLLFPIMLGSTARVGLLCGIFFVILLLSMHIRQLPSINAINRKSWGGILYPIAVLLVYIFYEHYGLSAGRIFRPMGYFTTPILVLSICDPLAAWAGSAFRKRHPDIPEGKTMAGSFTFLISAILLTTALAAYFSSARLPLQSYVLWGIMLAFVATLAERFSINGTDNLTIPLSIALTIYLMEIGLKNFAG